MTSPSLAPEQLTEDFNNLGVADRGEKLVIALDFGTTYSGIAFCFPNDRDTKIASVVSWPATYGESPPKVPTLIKYDGSGQDTFSWGASVERMSEKIIGIKLLLDPSQERPAYIPTANMRRIMKNLPKPAVEVASDFLRALYEHALTEIAKEVPNSYLAMCRKHFVLSVPAVWSNEAKNATLQAAKMAGIFPVDLIKEPEAAALHTIRSLGFGLKTGDAFVVCDAGGGTVDLISYEVTGLEPLRLRELVPGTGGMAGSLGLNQRFVEAVRNLVGDDQFHELRKTKAFALAERSFDREIKKAFRGHDHEEFYVNFPMATLEDDPEAGLVSNTWRMTGKDLRGIFAPLIADILRLIEDQIKSVKIKKRHTKITGIFLVGGFGSSHYLKACVERRYPDIQVLQPSDAWAAIAKGAALSTLPHEAAVVSTSSTKHYGIEWWTLYDPIKDEGQPTKVRKDGRIRAATMAWFIKIGDDILRDQEIRFSLHRTLDEGYTDKDLVFTKTLFECGDPTAPRHRAQSHDMIHNCELTVDLRSIDREKIKPVTGKNGKALFRIDHELILTLSSALMQFSIEIDGKRIGTVEAKFGRNT